MTTRLLCAAALVPGLVLALAGPASAAGDTDNIPVIGLPGSPDPMSTAGLILVFLVIPVAVYLVISAIYLRPGSTPGSVRYRPGRPWEAPDTWVGATPGETASDLTEAGGSRGSW